MLISVKFEGQNHFSFRKVDILRRWYRNYFFISGSKEFDVTTDPTDARVYVSKLGTDQLTKVAKVRRGCTSYMG